MRESQPKRRSKAERALTLETARQLNGLLNIPTESMSDREHGAVGIITGLMAEELRLDLLKDGINLPPVGSSKKRRKSTK
jgi:hypothetical protein